MLKNITWTEYCTAIFLLSAAYYLFIGLRYYTADIQGWFANRQKQRVRIDDKIEEAQIPNPVPVEETYDEQPFAATSEETFDEVEELVSRLKNKLAEPGSDQQSREELSRKLKAILLDYPQLKHSQFAPAIQELIATECGKNSSVALDEDEIATIWNE